MLRLDSSDREETAIIRVSHHELYEGRKRFSIAHELGHYVLGHGKNSDIICFDKDMIATLNDPGKESEANAFAGELLLPANLVAKRCDVKEVTFDPVREMAFQFKTSLTATLLKFVRLCPEMCAAIFCTGGRVKWVFKSEDFWPFVEVNKPLDRRTLAYDFFTGGGLSQDPEEVDADAWLDSERLGNIEEVVEHSVAMPSLRSVLSLLWVRMS